MGISSLLEIFVIPYYLINFETIILSYLGYLMFVLKKKISLQI